MPLPSERGQRSINKKAAPQRRATPKKRTTPQRRRTPAKSAPAPRRRRTPASRTPRKRNTPKRSAPARIQAPKKSKYKRNPANNIPFYRVVKNKALDDILRYTYSNYNENVGAGLEMIRKAVTTWKKDKGLEGSKGYQINFGNSSAGAKLRKALGLVSSVSKIGYYDRNGKYPKSTKTDSSKQKAEKREQKSKMIKEDLRKGYYPNSIATVNYLIKQLELNGKLQKINRPVSHQF